MNLLLIFTTAYLVAFSGALMPGPMLTVTIKESIQRGGRAGFLIVGGHGFAEILLLGLFFLGLNRLLQTGWISAVVGIGGGMVLLFMGFDVLRGALAAKINLDLENQGAFRHEDQKYAGSDLRPFIEGIIVSVANPTWILWWFSIGVLYVTQASRYGWLGLSAFYSGHILADLSWFVFVAYMIATGRKFLSPGIYRGILASCGAFLALLAVFFIYQGVRATLTLL
ncbi:MAG: LysE family transporter [Bacillota bacterium]|nr:LysE family transporter [Bacillota bacterium]